MLRFLFLLLFLIFFHSARAQNRLNLALKQELDSMYVLDQKYRHLMFQASKPATADSLTRVLGVSRDDLPGVLWRLQNEVDQSNLVRAEEIIQKHGYPGKSLVGSPTNQAVWYIIQHSGENSGKIKQYFPLMQKASQKGELESTLVAMMEDRLLMHEGKEQIYGTQGRCEQVPQLADGAKTQDCFIWPIKDPANVNKRRKEVGFDSTVEENAKRLGITYEVRKLPVKTGSKSPR